jgi:(1->4)-alpha-D-glucan 1-alpha-D-glucosylmutase
MLYQALIGAWEGRAETAFKERMEAYALKAAREGKQDTSWTNPDTDYEEALKRFVDGLLDPAVSSGFLASFTAFADRTALLGALNALSQLAIKTLAPGVPDFYQGTERWDFSLVDPDNRRRVDFSDYERSLPKPIVPIVELAARWRDGHLKHALTQRLLRLRHDHPEAFRSGEYVPLQLSGHHAAHAVAFRRTTRRDEFAIVIGRLFAALTDGGMHWPVGWRAVVELGTARYRNALTDGKELFSGKMELSELFSEIPLGVLRRE